MVTYPSANCGSSCLTSVFLRELKCFQLGIAIDKIVNNVDLCPNIIWLEICFFLTISFPPPSLRRSVYSVLQHLFLSSERDRPHSRYHTNIFHNFRPLFGSPELPFCNQQAVKSLTPSRLIRQSKRDDGLPRSHQRQISLLYKPPPPPLTLHSPICLLLLLLLPSTLPPSSHQS